MNHIKKARESAGFSQKEVAIELKVSAPTVSEWESGKKNPNTDNLKALSKMFNVPIDYLINGDSDYSFIDNSKKIVSRNPTGILCAMYSLPAYILADEISVDINTVEKWMSGFELPNDNQLNLIADFFELDIHELRKGITPLTPNWEIYQRIYEKKAPSTKMVLSRQALEFAKKYQSMDERSQDLLRTVVAYTTAASHEQSHQEAPASLQDAASLLVRQIGSQAESREVGEKKNV